MSSPTQTVTVRVVDRINNRPIAGAQVIVRQDRTTIAQTITNASGEAQFTLPHGTYTIRVSATNYQTPRSVSVTIPLSNPTVTIRLTPAQSPILPISLFGPTSTDSLTPTQTFTVRVVDRNNNAVANALVVIRQNQTTIVQAATNASGEAQFTLSHGSYTLEVTAAHFQPASMDIIVPVPNNLVTVTLQRLTQTVTFLVVNNANDAPLAGALVRILSRNAVITEVRTDQQGRASVTLEHGYEYIAEVLIDTETYPGITFSVPSPNTLLTIRLTFSFHFTVVDENNSPVPNVTVVIKNLNRSISLTRTTDSFGSVRENILNPGRYRVTVKKEGWKKVEKTYEYGNTQVGGIRDKIVLSPVRLRVIVLDPQGRPVRGASVRIIRGGQEIGSGNTA